MSKRWTKEECERLRQLALTARQDMIPKHPAMGCAPLTFVAIAGIAKKLGRSADAVWRRMRMLHL